jgi:hypothetical protein
VSAESPFFLVHFFTSDRAAPNLTAVYAEFIPARRTAAS